MACSWDANLTVSTMSGNESGGLHITWTPVANCGTFTFSNYRACFNRGATAPTDPSSADRCFQLGGPISKADADLFVHWSSTEHAVALFACDLPTDSCADRYGSFAGEATTDTTGTATTDEQEWVLTSIESLSDGSRTVADSYASAATAFYYSTGTHDKKLGLWWSTADNGRETIRYNRTDDIGWHDFNMLSSGDWAIGMSDGHDVAVEPDTGSTGAYLNCTHPWVVPMFVGTSPQVRMQLHCGAEGDTDIIRVDSVDDAGADFGLQCDGTCTADAVACPDGDLCDWDDDSEDGGEAVVDVCSDETSACFQLHHSGHGKYVWGSVFGNYVDFSVDAPTMVFTGVPRSKDGDCDGGQDDIYTATWTPGSPGSWSVPYTAGANGCPTATILDRHDPGVLALPGGEAKMVLHTGLTEFSLYYFDASTWSDPRPLTINFDAAGGEVDHACLENVDLFVYHGDQEVHEGAFFKARNVTNCFSTGGILFAERAN